MKKRIIPILLILGLLAAGAVYLSRRNGLDSDAVAFSGNIELTEVKASFKTAGRVSELLVKEGDPVAKGSVLARLDAEQLRSQREAQRAALAAAQSQLAQLQTAIEYQRETLAGTVAAAAADRRQAEARLRELESGARAQEIQEARAAADAARTEQSRTANDWQRAQVLYKNEDISAAQHDQYRAQQERAAAALRQAEQRLALVVEGPRKETIDAARAQAERAQAAVQLAEASRLELKRREQEVDARRAEVERARALLAVIESQLADTEILSPIDGVVLVKSAEPGETVAAGATVVTLGDIDHPWLRGYVNETRLGHVQLGQRVRVTTDSFPGKTYWGTISFIASEAEFTPKQIQTPDERVKLVYRLKVDLPNPQRELKLNMPADAEVLTGGLDTRGQAGKGTR
ncbi:MAG: HlyD family efflux transporter periplasmic adaptor subunit [Bryobacterales bacterium]|nr:HlyD family efflux transporter periplasmic adaptor subunit [Bryobacterales bacterium]